MNYFASFILILFLNSCINMGLEDLPVYNGTEITSLKFEYRYAISVGNSGEKMQVVELDTNCNIDEQSNTIVCQIVVPQPSGTFTKEEKNKVSLKNIVGIASISTAASIRSIDNAPKLGYISDFSNKEFQYEVIAADNKTKETWTIIIDSFINN